MAGPVAKGSTWPFLPFSKPGAPGDHWLLDSINGACQSVLAAGAVSFFIFLFPYLFLFK
jgi:hypothetical protein